MNRRWYVICVAILALSLLFRQPVFVIGCVLCLLVLLTTDIWARYCLHSLRVPPLHLVHTSCARRQTPQTG